MSDEHAARIAHIENVAALVLQEDANGDARQLAEEHIPYLLDRFASAEAERDQLRSELTAERARHAPLRARIKTIQDQHDQETGRLHAEIDRHKGCDEFWSETNMNNYQRWKQAEADLEQARQALQEQWEWNHAEHCDGTMQDDVCKAEPSGCQWPKPAALLAGHQQAPRGDGAGVGQD